MFLKKGLIAFGWILVIGLLSFVNKQIVPNETTVEISTRFGVMKFKLYNETPLHRDNFIKLANEGFYDSLLFHRVINQFMIQGGDPDSKNAAPGEMFGEGGPGYEITSEFVDSLFHKKGVLAAARNGDDVNPQRKSSGSQFYIVQGRVFDTLSLKAIEQRRIQQYWSYEFKQYMNQPENKELLDKYKYAMQNGDRLTASDIMNNAKPIINKRVEKYKFSPRQIEVYTTIGGTPHLDMAYTVFGEMIEGFEVLDIIAAQKTDKNDRPLEDIIMHIRVVQ